MELLILASYLITLAYHIQPGQCFQISDITSSTTVTSRPLVFGTVYDEKPPSTPGTPFKPSKQLFDRIYIPAATQEPPDATQEPSSEILEPIKNAGLQPSEALHINMFTLPTDSLDYNLLMGKRDVVDVDLQSYKNPQELSMEPMVIQEESAEIPDELVAKVPAGAIVKKEVHYHQHKHYHGYDHTSDDLHGLEKKKDQNYEEEGDVHKQSFKRGYSQLPKDVPLAPHELKEDHELHHQKYHNNSPAADNHNSGEEGLLQYDHKAIVEQEHSREHYHRPHHNKEYKNVSDKQHVRLVPRRHGQRSDHHDKKQNLETSREENSHNHKRKRRRHSKQIPHHQLPTIIVKTYQ